MRRVALLLLVLALGGALGTASAASPAAAGAKSDKTPACTECHSAADVKVQVNHRDCQTCHSGAAAHAKDPMKGKPNVAIASATCLSCHGTGKGHAKDANRMNFAFAEHNKAGVECRECHGIHQPKVGSQQNAATARVDSKSQLCATCHQDVVARFSMASHHPVKEGGISCTSCHEPHSAARTALGGKNERCTACHQAVRGPHVFEHPPAAEDCSNCHDPHGTPNKRLLSVAQPMLCMQCHSIAGNRHGQTGSTNNTQRITGAVLRDCASCHGAIHGSSIDQHLRH